MKISELPETTTVDDVDTVVVVRGGATQKAAVAKVKSTPGGSASEVQVKNGDSFAGATNVKAGSGYVSVGATPATDGALRLANNVGVQFRTADGTANISGLRSNEYDEVLVGDTAGASWTHVQSAATVSVRAPTVQVLSGAGVARLLLGGTGYDFLALGWTPASAGAVRLSNDDAINARNAAGSANYNLAKLDTSNNVVLGDASANITVQGKNGGSASVCATTTYLQNHDATATHVTVDSSGAFFTNNVNVDNTKALLGKNATGNAYYNLIKLDASNNVLLGDASAGDVNVKPNLSIGTDAATSGALRLANNVGVYARNAANDGNLSVIATDANNSTVIGNTATVTKVHGTYVVTSTSNGKGAVHRIVAEAPTADATVTTAASGTIVASVVTVEATVTAVTSDNTQAASYTRRMTFRNNAGTVTAVGTVQTIGTDVEDTAGWNATIDNSGTTWRVRVTGAAATDIRWCANVTVTMTAY